MLKFGLLVTVAATAQAASDEGVDVAAKITDMNARIASGGGDGADITRSAGQELVGEGLVNSGVSDAASQAIPASSATCARNWEHSCPDGWASLAGKCEAPTSYKGGCATSQSFDGAGVNDKARFASTCDAPWPCQGSCSRDYEGCPVGWESQGAGFCTSSGGSCGDVHKFDEYSIGTKQDFADACGFNWKCQESAAFLATESRAQVDPYKIRNSLYDTAFMRTPRQATVNVIEREGVGSAVEEGQLIAMQSRAARLRQTFQEGLAALS